MKTRINNKNMNLGIILIKFKKKVTLKFKIMRFKMKINKVIIIKNKFLKIKNIKKEINQIF